MLSGLTVLKLVTNELVVVVAILALMRGGRLERAFGLLLLLNDAFRFGLRDLAAHGDGLGWVSFVVFAGAVTAAMGWIAVRHRSAWAGAVFATYAAHSGIAVATLSEPRAHAVEESLLRLVGAVCLGVVTLRAWLGPPRRPPAREDVDLLAPAS